MSATDTIVIRTEGLSKAYGGVRTLDSLDLAVPQHSIFGFLGPNGAGKSTTIKLLLGLIRPSGGAAQVFSRDIVRDSVEIRARVGYLAQEPRFYEYMTARDTLRFTARFFYTGPRAGIEARVSEMLELVGLADRADRPIRGFSGGERQRLGIAQAEINDPDLLILDEPAAALDPQGRHDVLTVMERLRRRTTIFYSTHILEDVQRVSDTVAILNHGRLVAQAPIDDLLGGARGAAVYRLTVRGNSAAALGRLRGVPWITSVSGADEAGETALEVAVNDPAAADAGLLALVAGAPGVTVSGFGRKTHNLEEVFLSLIEGSEKHGH